MKRYDGLPHNKPLKAGTICDPTGRFHMWLVFEGGLDQRVSEESFATEKEAEDRLREWIRLEGYDPQLTAIN